MNLDPKQSRRILVIDDNRAIHDDFRKILTGGSTSSRNLADAEAALFGDQSQHDPAAGFEIESAYQGQEGLECVQRALGAGRPFAVAFIDVRMPPGWDGIETTAQIWKTDPDLQVVICTAYSDYSWDDMVARVGQSDRLLILKKPFDNIEVSQLAHALTEKWRLLQAAKVKTRELESAVLARTGELQAANVKLKAEMSEREKTEAALRQSQKMEALGQLAGGIAHDFNNLITIIQGYAQYLISEQPQTSDALESLQMIVGATDRAAKLTAQMLMFGRKKRIQPRHLDLNTVITELGKLMERILGEDISLQVECLAPALPVYGDPAMIEQVVLNMAVNARDAMPQGGKLKIFVEEITLTEADTRRNVRARAGRFACVRVADTGCGIAAEALPHLFEPFYTTKEPGKGTGLGLATAYGIINSHNGWIEVDSQPGAGANFRVYLPMDDSAKGVPTTPASPAKVPLASPTGNETILLAEDEPAVRQLAHNILKRQGYQVLAAASGREALVLWDQHKSAIDLLLTDMVMPDGLSGRELAERLKTEVPDLKVVYTTGYSLDAIGHNLVLEEGHNFLAKPYTPKALAAAVRKCLDHPQPCRPGEDGFSFPEPNLP